MGPLSLHPSLASPMSSFSHEQRVTSRREISHDPTASTPDDRTAPLWQGRAYPPRLCPCSTPARAVLPHIPRLARRTGAAALLPASAQRRRPRPSVHAPLLQWPPLFLPARPHARRAPPRPPARANHPPSPRRPPCGGGPAAPPGRHPLAQPRLLHHRLQLRPPAPGSPRPAGR